MADVVIQKVLCVLSHFTWNNDMLYFPWCASPSSNIPGVPKIQPQEFSSLDSSGFHMHLEQTQTDKEEYTTELC